MRDVFIEHHMSSSTKRHFKKRHNNSSTISTAAQNANRHLKNTELTPPHQNTPPQSTHQILSVRKIPYKVYGNTQVRIQFSTPKSNADDDYINMNMISHATKEERRIIKRQHHITSFVGAHDYREKLQDGGAEHNSSLTRSIKPSTTQKSTTSHKKILHLKEHIRYFLHVKSHTEAMTTLENGYPSQHQKTTTTLT